MTETEKNDLLEKIRREVGFFGQKNTATEAEIYARAARLMAEKNNFELKTYGETLDYMMRRLPMFQRVGASAFKKSLDNIIFLCHFLENPHQKFKSVHIAGTNGKGSTSHLLASVFTEAGLKTGLYTSPHLKSFTERIKINGKEIPENEVIAFVNRIAPLCELISPSFFEITVAMCFDFFAREKVDIAVIETGLGGRLDSTNIITPLLSLITNISYDHKDLLGDTLPAIAAEKAGIIKRKTPVVISKTQQEVREVFINKAAAEEAEIFFAQDSYEVILDKTDFVVFEKKSGERFALETPLRGIYQTTNFAGVWCALAVLDEKKLLSVSKKNTLDGFANVLKNTGFRGRWEKISEKPLVIADIGHNEDAWNFLPQQIQAQNFEKLFMVVGAVNDKDLSAILSRMPKNAFYCFCKPDVPRGLDAETLAAEAEKFDLRGRVFASVREAYGFAKSQASERDFIFVGGSTFVVAEIPTE
jgi:dihydrofolate synthase/folylpolyglutamate synthase